ncbi:Pyrrolidone-carboxylate peptidase [Rhodovulum sp. PH10]|uniref:pyroglutamyl-peptidase I n=1 Tax=Rhodovulum sp. PH10 TaxID=1187851 RepID=UPI00027C25AF|nr:pyroglutamyl-peptidase I [Rhodovulum sp. PH10]EJW13712.1 Pyrrolidone-carboxylate peptidase [Rhodovulum sp. PH10]
MVTKTILVTGFGAFPGAPRNPTTRMVATLLHGRHARRSDLRLVGHVFPTCWEAVDRELPALLKREQPDAVLLLGVATRANTVRIERVARNRASVLRPDAAKRSPSKRSIAPGAPLFRPGRFPAASLCAALRAAGARPVFSRDAGGYLCNYAYWRALEAAEQPDGPRLVVFVHVPPLPLAPRPERHPVRHQVRRPVPMRKRHTLAGHVAAANAAVAALASALRQRRVSQRTDVTPR